MKWNVSVLRRSGECERTEVADFELSEFFNRIASAEGKERVDGRACPSTLNQVWFFRS